MWVLLLILGCLGDTAANGTEESLTARVDHLTRILGETVRWSVSVPATASEPLKWQSGPSAWAGWHVLGQESIQHATTREVTFLVVADRSGDLRLGPAQLLLGAGPQARRYEVAAVSLQMLPLAHAPSSRWELWRPSDGGLGTRDLLLALAMLAVGAALGAVLARHRRRIRPLRRDQPRAWAREVFRRLCQRRAKAARPEDLDVLADVIRAELEARGHTHAGQAPLPDLVVHLPASCHATVARLEGQRFAGTPWVVEEWTRDLAVVGELLQAPVAPRGDP